jgi:hypothetical protein
MWIGYRVIVLDTHEGLKRSRKTRRRFKLIVGSGRSIEPQKNTAAYLAGETPDGKVSGYIRFPTAA